MRSGKPQTMPKLQLWRRLFRNMPNMWILIETLKNFLVFGHPADRWYRSLPKRRVNNIKCENDQKQPKMCPENSWFVSLLLPHESLGRPLCQRMVCQFTQYRKNTNSKSVWKKFISVLVCYSFKLNDKLFIYDSWNIKKDGNHENFTISTW